MKSPPLYCLLPLPMFQILSNPLHPPQPPPFFVALFLWLNGSSSHIWCFILLNNFMDLHMVSLGTLVSQGPWVCFMQQGISLLRSNTWHVFLLVLWFDITHKNKDTQQTEGPIDWISKIHWYQKFTLHNSIVSLLFNYWLVEMMCLLLRFNKTKFFPWNTKNTYRYGVKKQKTNHHSLRER